MKLFYLLLATTFVVTHCLPQGITVTVNKERRGQNICDCNGIKCGLVGRTHRVVGGSQTALTEMPWIAALFYKGKLYCGASLVNAQYMITAAHCIKRFRFSSVDLKRVEIVIGSHNISDRLESGRQVRGVAEWWSHPGFDRSSFNNDIGVIKLDRPLRLDGDVRPICLPETSGANYVGKKAIIAGWGRVSERGVNSEVLRKVSVPIMTNDDCKTKKYKPHEITDNMVCAGYDQGKLDACQGDSGGPMMLETRNDAGQQQLNMIGIVSWGQGCARAGYPGVYTRVENYLNFLREKVGGECLCPRN